MVSQRSMSERSQSKASSVQHFDTYKQLKAIAARDNPELTKSEIYEDLLKPFRHSKRTIKDGDSSKSRTLYICGYDNCQKDYTKIWNLLDHVRMHEGIKPYQCEL